MRRILLATTAITALALATPMALAQSSSGPNGALEEQKTAAGQKRQDRDSDDAQSWDAQWIARGSERSGPRSHAEREAGQAQQIEPNAQPPKGQRTNRAQQEPPTPPQPRAQERLNGQARPQTPGTAGEFNNAPRNAGSNNQRRPAAARPDQGNRSSARGNAGGREQVQVSEQQRTRIHERIGRLRTQRLNRADFSLEVGAAVPRSVRVYTLPPEIVEVVPEYRGYDYVLVGEDIVIIDPESHEIVAVIPA